MESQGLAGSIQLTGVTYHLLQDKYLLKERGLIPIKGKGEVTTYIITGRK